MKNICIPIAKFMQKFTVFSLLSTLSPGEMKEFSRFIRSPFFNGRKEAAEYFLIVKKHYPDFGGKNFTAEYIYGKMYPGKHFQPQAVRRLNSYLLKLLKEYMSYKGLKNDSFYFDLSLSIQLSERGLYKHSQRQLTYTDKKHSSSKSDYEFYFWKRYLIERQKNSLHSFAGNDHLASAAIIERTNMFANHTAVVACKSLISLLINEKNFGTEFLSEDFYALTGKLDLDDYIKSLEAKGSIFYPVIAAEYYQAMSLLNPGNNSFFGKFKAVIESGLDMFSYIEKINFYTIFEAVCMLKIEKGEVKYSKDLFEAYRQMLQKGLCSYSPGGKFILRIFRNIVHTAVLVKKTGWLEKFIDDYAPSLPDPSQNNMKNLAEAMLQFEKGNFGVSLKKLNSIDYDLFHFKIDLKNLQIRLYYELGYTEELISAIDSYRHFIAASKYISPRYKIMCSGFINNTSKLIKAKSSGSEDEVLWLKAKIHKTNGALYRDWFIEKLAAL